MACLVCRLGIAIAVVATICVSAPASAQYGGRRDEKAGKPKPKKRPKLTKPPQLIQAASPEYPKEAGKKGLEAAVKVRIKIDATGKVVDAKVVKPVGNGFDEAAVAAVRQYKFSPAEFDGKPAPITVETTIHFKLQKVEKPPLPLPPPTKKHENIPKGPPSHGGDPRRKITIEGEAVERGSRNRIPGVIVSIAELSMDAVTDNKGRFFMHGVPPGTYTILAVDEKYNRFTRKLTLKKNEKLNVRLWLRAKGGNPYETIVEGEREKLEVTKRTIERRVMTTVPGTFGDPVRVIQTLPGVARTPFGTGFLLIRGSNPDDSGVFIDGHRVPLLFHFLGGPSFLNPEFLQTINLYPGGFPVRFGRSQGGIVAVETRPAKSDGIHGSADVDLLDAGGYIRVPLGKNTSLALAGRRLYLDFMLSFFLPEQDPGSQLIVVPVYWDYQARIDHDMKENGTLSLFSIGSSDLLDVLSDDPKAEQSLDLTSAIRFFRIIATYKRPFAKGLTLTLSPAWGRDTITFNGTQAGADSNGAITGINVAMDTLSYRMRVNGKLNDKLRLDTGIDIESRVSNYRLKVPVIDDFRSFSGPNGISVDAENVIVNTDMLWYGAYLQLAIDPIKKLRLIPGLRADGYILDGHNRSSLDPRLVARYALNDEWTIKGYAGLFHQPPQPETLDPRFGNPQLGIEQSLHVGLGGEYKLGENWFFDGEAYYIRRTNQVTFTTDSVTDPNTGEVTDLRWVNRGRGDTIGIELLIKRRVTRNLFGWLSYTLSKSRQSTALNPELAPTFFDQRHNLNAVASYRTDNGWEFGGRLRFNTGTPVTPIVGSVFDADQGGYDSIRGPLRSDRRPSYLQVDVRAEKTWVFKTWRLGLYLDILNVFNFDNVEAVQYDYRFRHSAPVTGIPFVPTLGVRGKF